MSDTKTLKLQGLRYELTFTEVEKTESSRQLPNQGHDGREEGKTFIWRGKLQIKDGWCRDSIEQDFCSAAFFQDQVGNLGLEDILFLAVRTHLFRIEFVEEKSRCALIDYLATKLLASTVFATKKIFELPLLRLSTWDWPLNNLVVAAIERLSDFLRQNRVAP
jgi:hypothetical protein